MRRLILVDAIVLLAIFLAACGSGSAATPAPQDSGKPVNIKVDTNPNPAAIGDIELILNITDASGNPIEGATVDVTAIHTDMTGMDMSGAATEQGAGKYAINANFSMSGNWKLKVYVRKDGLDYSEEIDLLVQ
ncbi:MAG TPA: FixH family protein [Anaerolineales bacterium]|nr:FixH family protein [Anaerolineales bacterium]